MYTDKTNVLQLASLMRATGLRKVVIAPGSRNIPLTQTFTQCPDFTCYPVTDERSAGFFALGLALQSQEPVAVCCTSGSALLNLHPAVAEAYYQQVPLLVISADRPAAWIGQMDGQTLPQPGVFGSLVHYACQLTEAHTQEERWYNNRLINEALLNLERRVQGPVHINVPLSEPLFRFNTPELPDERVIDRLDDPYDPLLWANLHDTLAACTRRWVIVGQSSYAYPIIAEDNPHKDSFVWITEHLSNGTLDRATAVTDLDTLLYAADDDTRQRLMPELVITCEGHVVSKRLKQYLRSNPRLIHWHISPEGTVADLFGAMQYLIEMTPEEFFALLEYHLPEPFPYNIDYHSLIESLCPLPVPAFEYSAMQAIGLLFDRINRTAPEGTAIHLANSSAVRYAQLFPLRSDIHVLCNRGVNGIEGSLSTAVGYAAASDVPNYVVIGDLSYFYDRNALWNDSAPRTDLRILLLNNGGGEIFRALPGLDTDPHTRDFITGAHRTTAEAETPPPGFRYSQATDEQSLAEALRDFTSDADPHPRLLEVFTDPDEDVRLLRAYYQSLK